jgi:hypothetical protein
MLEKGVSKRTAAEVEFWVKMQRLTASYPCATKKG